MTTAADFADLRAAVGDDEVVTHSRVRDIPLPSGKTLALITLDNDRDHTRPSTLGPITLLELSDVLDQLKERAARKEIDAVGVTGKQFIFAAGADLSKVSETAESRRRETDGRARPLDAGQARQSSACRRSRSGTGSPSAVESRSG